jgi:hypothetical protein
MKTKFQNDDGADQGTPKLIKLVRKCALKRENSQGKTEEP